MAFLSLGLVAENAYAAAPAAKFATRYTQMFATGETFLPVIPTAWEKEDMLLFKDRDGGQHGNMPCTARASVGGMCYHVLNRGNGRAEVFHKDADYVAFLKLLREANERVSMRLLAWCLLPNHFHLAAWPREDGDSSRWMQWLLTSTSRKNEAELKALRECITRGRPATAGSGQLRRNSDWNLRSAIAGDRGMPQKSRTSPFSVVFRPGDVGKSIAGGRLAR